MVEEVLEFYSPIAEAAREYGIAPQPLDNWARKYRKSHGLQDDESGVTAVVKTVREQALEQED
ncbi:MAG TPA: transposase [Candidatus Yaniella excrementavium]|nr:transposase [Candidatus Yaniella excrementavium]